MALATLEFDGFDHGKALFKTQLGSNRYFQFAVGQSRRRGAHGLPELDDIEFSSALQGPVSETQVNGIRFAVDPNTFRSAESRVARPLWLQVKTYRSADKHGPAISEPIPLPGFIADELEIALPFLAERSGDAQMTQARQFSAQQAGAPIRVKAFRYQKKNLSNAMFIQALIPAITSALPAIGSAVSSALPAITSALPHVLPHLAPLLGGLLGSLGAQSGNQHAQRAGRTAEAVLNQVGSRENAQHIAALIQQVAQLQQNQGRGTNAAPAATPAQTPTAPAAQSLYANYSQAQVAPAVAALPALMPLLQQVLTPETVQGVLQMPNQHMQTIINGIKDVSQLALQSHEQDLRHLREIHPDLDDPALNQLLMSMSANLRNSPETVYQRVPAVELNLQSQPLMVSGAPKVLYSMLAQQWRFSFQVSTPRSIDDASVQLVIKDQRDLRVVLKKNFPVGEVSSGDVIDAAMLEPTDIARLQSNKDYLLIVHLIWRNQAGEKRGTSRQQIITPIQAAVFERIDEAGELIPLRDNRQFADHWHKIWQDRFTGEVGEHVIEARYYLQFDPAEDRLARYESQARFREENREKHGQLRTGVEWTFSTLDDLNRAMNPQAQVLSEAQKQALSHEDFVRRFGTVAHHRVDMRGSNGKLGEIWVYPVVKLQNVILQTIQTSIDSGAVTELAEQRLTLPIPVQVHYVGFRS